MGAGVPDHRGEQVTVTEAVSAREREYQVGSVVLRSYLTPPSRQTTGVRPEGHSESHPIDTGQAWRKTRENRLGVGSVRRESAADIAFNGKHAIEGCGNARLE